MHAALNIKPFLKKVTTSLLYPTQYGPYDLQDLEPSSRMHTITPRVLLHLTQLFGREKQNKVTILHINRYLHYIIMANVTVQNN